MAGEKVLVDADVFVAGNKIIDLKLSHTIYQQQRVPMWQVVHDLFDIDV